MNVFRGLDNFELASVQPARGRLLSTIAEDALRENIGLRHFDEQGWFRSRRQILVRGVAFKHLVESVLLERGSPAWRPETGLSLTLNSFLSWRRCPEALTIGNLRGFDQLRFGARCSTGVRGTPPKLDLLAMKGNRLAAVAAEGPAYLSRRSPELARAYRDYHVPDGLEGWAKVRQMIGRDGAYFYLLDAAALFKFAVGLDRNFPNRDCTLFYIYWAPLQPHEDPAINRHQFEIDRLSAMVSNDKIAFRALSFSDLWNAWQALPEPSWLPDLLSRLRERYSIRI